MILIFIFINKVLWSLILGIGLQFIYLAKRIRVMQDFLLFGFTLLIMALASVFFVWFPIYYAPQPFWYLTFQRATFGAVALLAVLVVEFHRRISATDRSALQKAFNWISIGVFTVLALESPFESGFLFDAYGYVDGVTQAFIPVFLPYFLLLIGLIISFFFRGLRSESAAHRYKMKLLLWSWGFLGLTFILDLFSGRFPWLPLEIVYTLFGLVVYSGVVAFLLLRNLFEVHACNVSSLNFLARAGSALQDALVYRRLGLATAGISHDLRNYTALLRSNGSMATQEPRTGDLLGLIDSLHRLSQRLPASSGFPLNPVPAKLDLAAIAADCSRQILGSGTLFLLESIPGDGAYVQGVATDFERVFHNLFRNSLEAGATEIRLKFTRANTALHVHLRDNGAGSAGNIAGVFHSSKRERGGLGLGLMVVREILARQGASLHVSNSGESGFDVELIFSDSVIPNT